MSSFSDNLEDDAAWDPARVSNWLEETSKSLGCPCSPQATYAASGQVGHLRHVEQEFVAGYQQRLAEITQCQSYTQRISEAAHLQNLATDSPSPALLADLALLKAQTQATPAAVVDTVPASTMTPQRQSTNPTATPSQQKSRRIAGDPNVDPFECPRCSRAYVKKRSAQEHLVKFHDLSWDEVKETAIARRSEVVAVEPVPSIEKQPWEEEEQEELVPMKVVVKPYGVVWAPDNGTSSPPPPAVAAPVVDDGESLGSRDTTEWEPMQREYAAQDFKLWEDDDADQDVPMGVDDENEDNDEED